MSDKAKEKQGPANPSRLETTQRAVTACTRPKDLEDLKFLRQIHH